MTVDELIRKLQERPSGEEIFVHRTIFEDGNIVGANVWEITDVSLTLVGEKNVLIISV